MNRAPVIDVCSIGSGGDKLKKSMSTVGNVSHFALSTRAVRASFTHSNP